MLFHTPPDNPRAGHHPVQMSILPQSCLFVLIASPVVLITSPIINSLCAGERPGNPSPSSPHSLSGGP